MEQTTASSGVSVEAAELTGSSRSSKSSPATKGSGGTSLAKAPPPVAVTMPKTVVAQEDIRTPAISAALVLPDRVIAGQNMTASAITTVGAGEPSVELSFNNSSIFTDKHGLAFYEVPEDATPGRSLNISFTARTESQPVAIEVIQPLSTSSGQQAPKMERIALTGGNRVAIIDGHNFDGYGQQNRVTIDGRTEAKVLASSPVQVKVLLPSTILPGVHSVAITVGGTRSAAIAFKIAGSQNAHRTAARQ
jgi:hypothetical protein